MLKSIEVSFAKNIYYTKQGNIPCFICYRGYGRTNIIKYIPFVCQRLTQTKTAILCIYLLYVWGQTPCLSSSERICYKIEIQIDFGICQGLCCVKTSVNINHRYRAYENPLYSFYKRGKVSFFVAAFWNISLKSCSRAIVFNKIRKIHWVSRQNMLSMWVCFVIAMSTTQIKWTQGLVSILQKDWTLNHR